MPLLSFFRKKEPGEPLVEIPQPEEPIEFDDEEQQAMRSGWPSTFVDAGDMILSDDGSLVIEAEEADAFRRQLAAGSLSKLAHQRFQRGELERAASTCVKAIGLCGYHEAWLLLAEVHAASGDFGRAQRILGEAQRAARRAGVGVDSAFWKPKVDALRAQIKSRHRPT